MRVRANARPLPDRGLAFAEARRRQQVDELVDLLRQLRESCATVAVSYEVWGCADRPDKALAFRVYAAALDREQQAANAYQRAVAQLTPA